MKAYVFPGQGSQFCGMGSNLYEDYKEAKELFEEANTILNFRITDIMFGEDPNSLKQTKITQPAIFLHSVILAKLLKNNFEPDMVAGHSLGEFSALVATNYITFKDGLTLVLERAKAMQKACEMQPSTMAAIIGLDDSLVTNICENINHIVVAANYNCPGQVVISGSIKGVDKACEELKNAGARKALKLPVGGAFHSPIMKPAKKQLEKAIQKTIFSKGICPIYQNVTATAISDPEIIKENLITQLTSSVRWTQTMQQMIKDGLNSVTEVGPGKVLQGLFKKVDREIDVESVIL